MSMLPPEITERLADLYREGVNGLDVVFGEWFERLEASGYLDRHYFVFTRDHGEAFFEHDRFGHGGEHWEERVRVPFFVLGGGLEPRTVTYAATLLDAPRTLVRLVGLPGGEAWGGADLLDLDESRDVRTYAMLPEEDRVTIQGEGRKLYVRLNRENLGESEIVRAFDLSSDPGELHDLVDSGLPWLRELWMRSRAQIARELVPAVSGVEVQLSEEERQHMNDIGYGEH